MFYKTSDFKYKLNKIYVEDGDQVLVNDYI